MTFTTFPRALFAAAACVLSLAVPGIVQASGSTAACIENNESAQDLERQGKMIDARTAALACSQNCPTPIAQDCTQVAQRITEKTPTVAFGAKRGTSDLADVEVELDGKPLLSRLDGASIPIDPGARRVTFRTAGSEPITVDVVIKVGEKNRLVSVDFPVTGRADAMPKPAEAAPAGPRVDDAASAPPALFWVLAGASVASFATAGVLGGLTLSERGALDPCIQTKTCLQADVTSVETKALVTDVMLGVGGATALGAVLAWALWPASAEQTVVAIPLDRGGFVSIGGRF